MRFFSTILLVLFTLTLSFGQNKKDYKYINELLKSGIITEPEAKQMIYRSSLNASDVLAPSEINSTLPLGANDVGAIEDLFKVYLKHVGVEPFERAPSNYTEDGRPPDPGELAITDFLPAVSGYQEVLEGFLPFLVDLFSGNDVPKPLAIFKWITYGKTIYRENPELRGKF